MKLNRVLKLYLGADFEDSFNGKVVREVREHSGYYPVLSGVLANKEYIPMDTKVTKELLEDLESAFVEVSMEEFEKDYDYYLDYMDASKRLKESFVREEQDEKLAVIAA